MKAKLLAKSVLGYASLALVLMILAMPMAHANSSPLPLEILNIKPAGSGNPAIPTTHRIFRAYPGIEYNIRAAVIGGTYPYTFSLSNEPSGMKINALSGEIVWDNPQSTAENIQITVVDSAGNRATSQWSITVTTNGFVFVDSKHSGQESGTIDNPYRSLANMLSATIGRTADIVYFREGSYPLVQWNTDRPATDISNNPRVWLGYPGEHININGQNTRRITAWNTFYLDNLNISDVLDYGIMFYGPTHYNTIRNTTWNRITSSTSTNNNQGFLHSTAGDGRGYGLVIQDNIFSDFTGAQAIGSLYNGNKTLIEGNTTQDGGKRGPHGFATPIGLKARMTNATVRGNKIYLTSDSTNFELYNEIEHHNLDFSFNLVIREGGFPKESLRFFYPTNVHIYRNTFVGDIRFLPSLSQGPYYFKNNVLIGSLVNTSYVTVENNIIGMPNNNIIDAQGNLTSSYYEYLGTHGHQLLSDTKAIRPPSNVRFSN